MNIGILGTGAVARALAGGFLERGRAVKFGTRDPRSGKARALVAKVPQVSIGSFADAAT